MQVFVTAGEAYPALDCAFLTAEHEISAGFRVFDLKTQLRSDEARDIGDTWFALVIQTLRPGVALRSFLSDFDPIARPRLMSLPPLCPATHHQKLAVFDRKRLYVGGLDLDERFYDTPDHHLLGQETWHDVQLMVEGPVARDAAAHLDGFLNIIAGHAPARRPCP